MSAATRGEVDAALGEVADACGGHARAADGGDAVAGVPARLVASPGTTQEAAAVLRVAAAHRLRVVFRGNGSKLHWGAPPEALDLLLDTARLSGVTEHAAGDLVVVAGSGTPLADLQETVGSARQELAFDDALGSTVGGALATAPSGPRRLLRGTLRDLLIGVTFVRADGVVAKAGGKVVKNVAGYDFGKLLTGSYGTLGLVTEAVFRLHPRPPRAQHVTCAYDDPADAATALRAVLGSQTVPSAVEVDRPAEGPTVVDVLLEGTDDGVRQRAAAVATLLGGADQDGDRPQWWGHFPFAGDDVALKVTCAVTDVASTVALAHDTATELGVRAAVRGSAAGVLHVGLPGDSPGPYVATLLSRLRAAVAGGGGSVVLLAAPDPVRAAVDAWGPVPGLTLMRRLKAELDPDRRLAPGRFVGGI